MAKSTGDRLPQAQLLTTGDPVDPAALPGRIAVFGLPGAFTGTCSNAHMPSFIRSVDAFRAKGIERILCVTVNDPFVAAAWAKETGATEAGIEVLADADGSFTKAMGLDFSAPQVGLIGRSKRYAMLVRDGVIEALDVEDSPGTCAVSAGEALLAKA